MMSQPLAPVFLHMLAECRLYTHSMQTQVDSKQKADFVVPMFQVPLHKLCPYRSTQYGWIHPVSRPNLAVCCNNNVLMLTALFKQDYT